MIDALVYIDIALTTSVFSTGTFMLVSMAVSTIKPQAQ